MVRLSLHGVRTDRRETQLQPETGRKQVVRDLWTGAARGKAPNRVDSCQGAHIQAGGEIWQSAPLQLASCTLCSRRCHSLHVCVQMH